MNGRHNQIIRFFICIAKRSVYIYINPYLLLNRYPFQRWAYNRRDRTVSYLMLRCHRLLPFVSVAFRYLVCALGLIQSLSIAVNSVIFGANTAGICEQTRRLCWKIQSCMMIPYSHEVELREGKMLNLYYCLHELNLTACWVKTVNHVLQRLQWRY